MTNCKNCGSSDYDIIGTVQVCNHCKTKTPIQKHEFNFNSGTPQVGVIGINLGNISVSGDGLVIGSGNTIRSGHSSVSTQSGDTIMGSGNNYGDLVGKTIMGSGNTIASARNCTIMGSGNKVKKDLGGNTVLGSGNKVG